MPSDVDTEYTDVDLAIAIEEFYAGMVEPHHTTYEALPMAESYQKRTPQSTAYNTIAKALYTCRPSMVEDSAEMQAYLAGINALCVAWSLTNPQFDEYRFLDLAAIERRDGKLVLLPF